MYRKKNWRIFIIYKVNVLCLVLRLHFKTRLYRISDHSFLAGSDAPSIQNNGCTQLYSNLWCGRRLISFATVQHHWKNPTLLLDKRCSWWLSFLVFSPDFRSFVWRFDIALNEWCIHLTRFFYRTSHSKRCRAPFRCRLSARPSACQTPVLC